MNLIADNPYRTLGVFCGASTREIQKQLAMVKAFSRVGKQSKLETDFEFLDCVKRDLDLITEAANKIEQARNKVLYSLFWFQKANHIDETALGYLSKNETEKAIEIWSKLIDVSNHVANAKNFSAYLNLSTLYIELGIKKNNLESIITGFQLKGILISSEQFDHFVRSVGGENLVLNKDVITSDITSEILALTKQGKLELSFAQILDALKTFPPKILDELRKKYTEQPIQLIEKEIEFAKEMRGESPEEANDYGINLYKNTKQSLLLLVQILGKTNIEVKALANNLAGEIIQCSIDFFNNHRDDDGFDPGEDSLKLAKMAKSICPPGATMNRINENLETIQEWVDETPGRQKHQIIASDLAFISEKLERFQKLDDTVQNAKDLINSCKPKLLNIKSSLGSGDELYLKVSSTVVSNAQGMLVAAVNEAQDDFKNSPLSGLSQPQFEMVNGRMQVKTTRYVSLSELYNIISDAYNVTVSIESMDMVPNLRQQYLSNKDTLGNIRNQINSATRNVSSTSSRSSSSSGCYIATMAYGDYSHPKVLVLRTYRDEVMMNKFFGRVLVSIYYLVSPTLVKVLKNNKLINSGIRNILNKIIDKIQK